MTNPLLEKHPLPPFAEIRAEHVVPAISTILLEAKQAVARLAADRPCTWDKLVKGREELEDRLHQAWSPVAHLNAVMNTPEIREAYEACLPLITDYYTELGQDRQLFEAYRAIADDPGFADLPAAARKVVDTRCATSGCRA